MSDETPGEHDVPKPALSRRDFLKIAGREAADTGTKVIPGASLARAAVERPWWKRVAAWRTERAAENTAVPTDPAPSPATETSESAEKS